MVAALILLAGLQAQSEPAPSISPQQIFDQARERVLQQVKRSVNYTCVLTIDRSSSEQSGPSRGCAAQARPVSVRPVMHDRLRLEVADLDGQEIFSWYGSKRFSTASVDEVVKNGPISSGTFVGYLQNIFFTKGVHIRMVRDHRFSDNLHHFEYDVPLAASGYYVSAGSGRALSAFSGAFSVDPETLDLNHLIVVINSPPKRSKLCHVRSVVEYQTVAIRGAPSRIPKRFTLEMEDETGTYTVSRSEYGQCRAFTGESTVTYEIPDSTAVTPTIKKRDEHLPAGIVLPVTLRTPIDDLHSLTGDPVEGTLARDTKLPGKRGMLPKGAEVTGFISRLENRYLPSNHVVLGIRFNQITVGNDSYLFDAQLVAGNSGTNILRQIYGRSFSPDLSELYGPGVLIFAASHAHLDQHFTAEWITVKTKDTETR